MYLLIKMIKDRMQGKVHNLKKRSSKWKKVRAEHLKKFPECEACGETKGLEVHHMSPFSYFPEYELESWNLITLCDNKSNGIRCHQAIGHSGNYRIFNPYVRADAKKFRERLEENRRMFGN